MSVSTKIATKSCVALAVAGGLLAGGLVLAGAAAAAPPSYEPDANAVGTVTLYDANGVQVTSGSTTVHPFATYFAASGGNTPGSPAGSSGATAIAATPRDGVNSQNWSNDTLSATTDFGPTASASYPGSLKNSSMAIAKATPTDFSLDDYIGEYPAASTTDPGVYQIRVATGNPVNFYSMDVKVTGSTWTQVYPATASTTSTSTSVTAAPASPSTVGDNVTFTAAVTPTAAAGTVQFKDGTTNLGTAQTVTNGSAQYATTSLTAATHSITAVFSPTDTTTYSGSTSPAVSYVVNAKPATATTTSLAVTPTSPAPAGQQETLTATVTSGAAGTVTFMDDTTALGTAVAVANGTAAKNVTLVSGSHSLTAVFTPTDPSAYQGSTSDPTQYVVKDPARPTTTTVVATPASPQQANTSVTFTATVTPNTATGTVQFKDDTTALGSPVTVANGSTQYSTAALTKGTHPITAVFTPSDSDVFNASPSTVLNFVVAEYPGLPASILAAARNQSATVTWAAPTNTGGTPITGYDLQQSTDGSTWTTAAPGGTRVSTATSKVVTGLTNGKGYLFRVAAINGIGTGAYRSTTTKATPVADATALTISAPRSVSYAAAATVSTVVTNARDHSRVARVPVSLYRRVAGKSVYSLVRTVTTSASGTAAYRLAVTSNSAYYWHFGGNAAQKAANSGAVTVAVTPKVSISVKGKKVKHGKTTKVYGASNPAPSGERVYLQRLLKGKWSNQASTTIHRQKLPNGRTSLGYAFSRKLTKKGTYTFRVVTAATAYSTAGTTGRLTVRAT